MLYLLQGLGALEDAEVWAALLLCFGGLEQTLFYLWSQIHVAQMGKAGHFRPPARGQIVS